MKINRKKIEVLAILSLFLFTLYMWALPIKNNPLPFGEVDAGSHFALADYMGQNDKVITILPYYIDLRYGEDNMFKHHTLWYAPPYHLNLGIMQIIGGERIVPVYLFVAILCSLIVLTSYFVINKLYGFWVAFLSSLIISFSTRDILNFLWGQWPERISYALIPLILYCFYRFCYSVADNSAQPKYLYITSILLGIAFLLHPMGFFYAAVVLFVFFIVFSIKERKNIFTKKSLKPIIFSILLFFAISLIFPLQFMNVAVQLVQKQSSVDIAPLSSLLHWSKDPSKYVGAVPAEYFSYGAMHGLWTMPLLILGLIILVFRRKRQDILLLSWLAAIYLMVHLDVIGKGFFSHRSLSASAHIFSPIIVIGLMSLPQFIKSVNSGVGKISKYLIIILFIFIVIFINGKLAYSQLEGAYPGPMRLTQPQYEAAEWMKSNLVESADVEIYGTFNLAKKRWIQYVSQRHINHINNFDDYSDNISSNHIFIDYSDAYFLRSYPEFQAQLQELSDYEKNLTGVSLIYGKELVKVYEIVPD